ncbi:MAG: hypothetical protein WD894_01825 [Pirellulales bacterium]
MSGLESTFDDKQWLLEELTIDTLYRHGEVNQDGLNVSMARYFLKLTPHERLVFMERHRNTLAYHQGIEPPNDYA